MDEKIRKQLQIKKISEFKNPTILMNDEDFETFKKELESNIVNFKVGSKPTYNGISIRISSLIEKGIVTVCDDLFS